MGWVWRLAVGAWVCAVLAGFTVVWRYASTPSTPTVAPMTWPADTHLQRTADRATLVMFVHPRCACSRASVADLGRLLQRAGGQVDTTVVFVGPPGGSELRAAVLRLPGVVLFDDDGTEARRFGTATSGATILYDATGRLAFAGGLTDVRGHEGRSFGEERIVAILEGRKADRDTSPVFGCTLFDPVGGS